MASTSMQPAEALRRPKLAGRDLHLGEVVVEVLPPAARISLRAPAASLPELSAALGVALPSTPKSSATAAGRLALWLGPDEWLVIDEAEGDLLGDLAGVGALHSAVGISHRNTAFLVSGKASEAALNGGCPQDLSIEAFPVGACSRTVLGKAEIVLHRISAEAFRVECWRSFADYVFGLLSDAARDADAEAGR